MIRTAPSAPAGPWRAIARWALGLVLLVAVGYPLYSHTAELAQAHLRFDGAWGLAALAGLGLFFVLQCEVWRRLILGTGASLGYAEAFRILFYSNVAKYLPGSVWNMVGRVVLAERAGVPAISTTLSLLLETACQLAAALIVALLALPAVGSHLPIDPRLLALLPIAIAIGMHPRWLNAVLALARRLTGRNLPMLPYGWGFVLAMVAFSSLNWAVLGASFALLGQALWSAPLGLNGFLLLTGAFPLAWNIGVLAFMLPAGLGVREAVLVGLLAGTFNPGWAAALAIAARVWFMLGELAAFGLAALLGTRRR